MVMATQLDNRGLICHHISRYGQFQSTQRPVAHRALCFGKFMISDDDLRLIMLQGDICTPENLAIKISTEFIRTNDIPVGYEPFMLFDWLYGYDEGSVVSINYVSRYSINCNCNCNCSSILKPAILRYAV